jgi:HSP20 family protein
MLVRCDSYREFDRLTEQLASTASRAPRAFPMDAYRCGEQFIVQFDLPGVEPAAIDLTVEQNVLTVRASGALSRDRKTGWSWPSGCMARTRARSSSATRSTPNTCRPICEHGVLTLTIPVAETATPRRVRVGGSAGAQTIELQAAGGA